MFDLPFNRRALPERMILLASAAAVPNLGSTSLAQATEGSPAYFDAAHFVLLSAVVDTLISRTDTPGALDAKVPASFDALLANWASPSRRMELAQALRAIDVQAREQEKAGFTQLSRQRRARFLTTYDAKALMPAPPRADMSNGQSPTLAAAVADPAYAGLKELIVILYYLSEPALTHELSYLQTPGEWQPSIPVTPQTRPAGGGLF